MRKVDYWESNLERLFVKSVRTFNKVLYGKFTKYSWPKYDKTVKWQGCEAILTNMWKFTLVSYLILFVLSPMANDNGPTVGKI